MTMGETVCATLTRTDIDAAVGRLSLSIALARGHLAVRGATTTEPVAAALATAANALASSEALVDPRRLVRLRAVAESLAALLEELGAIAAQRFPSAA